MTLDYTSQTQNSQKETSLALIHQIVNYTQINGPIPADSLLYKSIELHELHSGPSGSSEKANRVLRKAFARYVRQQGGLHE